MSNKAIQRYVYTANYESSGAEGTIRRFLTIIAPHFKRAANKAIKNTNAGEILVSVHKQDEAVV